MEKRNRLSNDTIKGLNQKMIKKLNAPFYIYASRAYGRYCECNDCHSQVLLDLKCNYVCPICHGHLPGNKVISYMEFLQIAADCNQRIVFKRKENNRYYSIVSCCSFTTCDNAEINFGRVGGAVESPNNIDQRGGSWIDKTSCVINNAEISDFSCIRGKSIISDNAMVAGFTLVLQSFIQGNSLVRAMGGETFKQRKTCILKSLISGNIYINGIHLISESKISGNFYSDNSKTTKRVEIKNKTLGEHENSRTKERV